MNGPDFPIVEATIVDTQHVFAEGRLTSLQLVDFYLNMIESLNPLLHGILEVNPEARLQAKRADREREEAGGGRRWSLGELHSVPVMVKVSRATKDEMNTTMGSYALLGSEVARERLNPYVESGDPCGSSSGSAISVAANMVAVSLGTETDASIICPADHNSVVGIKPTVGLTSRAGVDPNQSSEIIALTTEFKVFLNKYLEELVKSPVRSLADANAFNLDNPDLLILATCPLREMMEKYGQEQLIASERTNGIGEDVLKAVELMKKLSEDGFENSFLFTVFFA
ncbi:hypothetical protein TIFTF001_017854 [Ficus carica]|uniref:Amidase domain-containing protein n=1 Tax=Ficus carica TaxID=3494 RepID=A0AA88DJ41_FICCA|nr:hypothetical protein TIFTF001_017854 [Ficus carica]